MGNRIFWKQAFLSKSRNFRDYLTLLNQKIAKFMNKACLKMPRKRHSQLFVYCRRMRAHLSFRIQMESALDIYVTLFTKNYFMTHERAIKFYGHICLYMNSKVSNIFFNSKDSVSGTNYLIFESRQGRNLVHGFDTIFRLCVFKLFSSPLTISVNG